MLATVSSFEKLEGLPAEREVLASLDLSLEPGLIAEFPWASGPSLWAPGASPHREGDSCVDPSLPLFF